MGNLTNRYLIDLKKPYFSKVSNLVWFITTTCFVFVAFIVSVSANILQLYRNSKLTLTQQLNYNANSHNILQNHYRVLTVNKPFNAELVITPRSWYICIANDDGNSTVKWLMHMYHIWSTWRFSTGGTNNARIKPLFSRSARYRNGRFFNIHEFFKSPIMSYLLFPALLLHRWRILKYYF